MENKSVFALLIGVGDYRQLNTANLPTYRMDLTLIGSSLMAGLKVPNDNLRILAGNDNNGFVSTTDLAKSIADFKSLLGSEDTFIFYFSGHGRDKNLIFSNGQVDLQSIIEYINKLPAKNKIVILDCCYSGEFKTSGARIMHFEESMDTFASHGIAVLASCSGSEVSRMGPGGNHSLFTGALASAIALNKKISHGKTTLVDIYDETMKLVNVWNTQNPDKVQKPVFRTNMGGTIYFTVEEYHPYKQEEVTFETEQYKVVNVEPLSSPTVKRLCAFVILKSERQLSELPVISKEIADRIKYADVYSTAASETMFVGTPARAVWCYFGYDETDMVNHIYYAHTIWAADDEMQRVNFKPNKNANVIDNIYVYENIDYKGLKKLTKSSQSREEFIASNRELLSIVINLGGEFIVDMQEVANHTLTIDIILEKYKDWVVKVRNNYLRISNGEIAPNDLNKWTEEILNLAGWVLDLSLLIENKNGDGVIGEREQWLIHDAIRKYNASIEKLRIIEEEIEW